MDCDDVALMLAASERPTLTGAEETLLENHLADCETCQRLRIDVAEEDWRWIARVPEEALADPNLLVLPTVDPVVFEHRAEVAAGGMGRISRVHDRRLGRDVAVKEMLAPDMRARFEREAMITARLQHPAIVPIYEAGTWPDGSAFYTMRLVEGGTLASAIGRAETLEARLRLLPHVIAATEALAYAHSRGVIHRDLKPGNVLVGEFGETVVIDWGLAKQLGHDDAAEAVRHTVREGLTMVGSVLGTPGFMSPEQAAGEALDERADVYALGSILYHLLAGQPPYWDEDVLRNNSDLLVDVARKRAPTPIVELSPNAPPDLRAIVDQAMARDKAARYRDARAMADELRRFEAGQLLASREYRVRDLLWRWIKKHGTAVIVATIAIIVLAAVGVVAIRNITRTRAVAEQSSRTAKANLAALLEEQGRIELLAGQRDRALAFLAAAYRNGRDTVALEHLLGVATKDLDLFDYAIADYRTSTVRFTPDGALVVAAAPKDSIEIYRDDRMVATHQLESYTTTWFDPDAERIFTDRYEQGVVMYEVATGKRLWGGQALTDVRDVVFDPSGEKLAIWSYRTSNSNVQVRDAATGELVMTVDGQIYDATFDEQGARLAVAGAEGKIRVYDLATKQSVSSLETDQSFDKLRFVDDDTIVASTHERGGLLLWRLDQKVARSLGGHTAAVTAIDISPFQHWIVTGDENGGLRLWSPLGVPLAEAHDMGGSIARLRYSPDGAFIAGAGKDRRAYIWESSTLALRGAVEASSTAIEEIAWSPAGDRLVTIPALDDGAKVWRLPRGVRVKRLASGHSAARGDRVAVLDTDELRLHDTDGKQLASYELPFEVTIVRKGTLLGDLPEIQLTRDAKQALVVGNKRAAIYDVAAGTHRDFDRLAPFPARNPEITLDGRWILEIEDHVVRVTDATTMVKVFERRWDSPTVPMIDGSRLVVMLFDDVKAFDLPSGNEVPYTLPMHQWKGAFDPAGKHLVVVDNSDARVFDPTTRKQITKLVSPADIERMRFDANGKWMIATCYDNAARLFDLDTGALLASVDAVTEGAVALSDDGLRFATGHDDGTIRIWDTASGRLLQAIRAHRNKVVTLAFAANDTRLVTLAEDAHTSIFDVHLEQRSPAEIGALADKYTHWGFADGRLVHATGGE